MLLINGTVILIVAVNALAFLTGFGTAIPFPFDISDFRRGFRVKSNTKIKIYIDHGVLHINEVHNVMEKNSLFKSITTQFEIRSSSERKKE